MNFHEFSLDFDVFLFIFMAGHVWQLSLRQRGSRAVQEAIELCSSDEEREAIASELAGHIWEASHTLILFNFNYLYYIYV